MNSGERTALVEQIAQRVVGYREGEIPAPTSAHVERWVTQFDAQEQADILRETAHILGQVYVPKAVVTAFVTKLANNAKLVGDDAKAFWQSVGFLRLQHESQSQADLLDLLDEVLQANFGLNTERETSTNGTYIYIDDAIFSGNQVRNDLIKWIEDANVHDTTIHVIVICWHRSGQWYANKNIREVARPRNVVLHWWRSTEIEDWSNRPEKASIVNILWPTELPNDQHVKSWLTAIPEDRRYFIARPAVTSGRNDFFVSEASRNVLEQAFLRKGAYIRSLPRDPSALMRPLGYNKLHGPGFGTMFATYRNCPNNCPLVMWWGDPDAARPLNQWYPLLQRRTRRRNAAADFAIEDIEF